MSETKQIISKYDVCEVLLNDPKIRFAGIINSKGRLVSGGFRKEILPYENDEKRQMMYMQVVLDFSMRKEFDDTLGPIHFTTTRRGRVSMTSIPLDDNLLLVSSEPDVDISKMVSKVMELLCYFQHQSSELEKKHLFEKQKEN